MTYKVKGVRCALILSTSICLLNVGTLSAWSDPYSSNNGMYPAADEYSGRFTVSNLDYPTDTPATYWQPGGGLGGPLTVANAHQYMDALKDYLEPTLRTLIEDHDRWDPVKAGWYDMIWEGAGNPTDPTSGREAILNSYGGQIMPPETWAPPYQPTTHVQNYGVVYYDEMAASFLGHVWQDVYRPDLSDFSFPEGSVVVKAEAATVQPEQWPSPETGSVLAGAAQWQVFRPTTAQQIKANQGEAVVWKNVVQTIYPFQMAIKVKDSIASPQTGWVYMGFVYDARQSGSPWDRFIPAGMIWGNDPQFARLPNGKPSDQDLTETWVNPDAPAFVFDTLGWGGRMAAPMDVGTRHNVLTPSGKRYTGDDGVAASSCLSCHGSSEYPFSVNLYPSPNRSFPMDGNPFLLFDQGSTDWAKWFQNRSGSEPISGNFSGVALDYDLMTMFALSALAEATGDSGFYFERFNVH